MLVALTRNRPSTRAGPAQTQTSVSQSHDNGNVSHRIPGKVDMANSSNLHPIRRSSNLPEFVEPVRGFANMLTLRWKMILHGNAGEMGKYAVLSVLPDKIARFLNFSV